MFIQLADVIHIFRSLLSNVIGTIQTGAFSGLSHFTALFVRADDMMRIRIHCLSLNFKFLYLHVSSMFGDAKR